MVSSLTSMYELPPLLNLNINCIELNLMCYEHY